MCSVCSVCSVCSALRACGAYNPTELKRLQHGQKITNMLENQVQQHMVFKKKAVYFLAFSKAIFLPFPRLWNPAICCRLYAYICTMPFPRQKPFPRPKPFPRQGLFQGMTILFQGQKPFSRPPAFKARSLFQGKNLFQGKAFSKA